MIADRVLGLVGGGMILLALLVLIFGGPGDGGAAPEARPPALAIVSPADGERVTGAVTVEFTSAAELAPQPGGWGTGGRHVHLDVDGREYMAAGETISRLPSGRYRWSLGQLPRGEHAIRLFWSDEQHRPIPEAATPPVRVRIP